MQYTFKLPYIELWYCEGTYIIWIYKRSWISMLGNRVNGNVWKTIDNIKTF